MQPNDWRRLLESDQLPALIEHFDKQFTAVAADQRSIKAAQDALREQINAVNARIDTTNSQLTVVRERVQETLDQTRRTNGTVTDLRLWRERVEGRISGVKEGAGGTGHIIAATVGVLVGVAGVVIGIVGLAGGV